jgi:hypothetical protein
MSISPSDLSALCPGRIAAAPSFVHRPTRVVVDGQRHRGVTGDLLHGGDAEQAVLLELAGQVLGLA